MSNFKRKRESDEGCFHIISSSSIGNITSFLTCYDMVHLASTNSTMKSIIFSEPTIKRRVLQEYYNLVKGFRIPAVNIWTKLYIVQMGMDRCYICTSIKSDGDYVCDTCASLYREKSKIYRTTIFKEYLLPKHIVDRVEYEKTRNKHNPDMGAYLYPTWVISEIANHYHSKNGGLEAVKKKKEEDRELKKMKREQNIDVFSKQLFEELKNTTYQFDSEFIEEHVLPRIESFYARKNISSALRNIIDSFKNYKNSVAKLILEELPTELVIHFNIQDIMDVDVQDFCSKDDMLQHVYTLLDCQEKVDILVNAYKRNIRSSTITDREFTYMAQQNLSVQQVSQIVQLSDKKHKRS